MKFGALASHSRIQYWDGIQPSNLLLNLLSAVAILTVDIRVLRGLHPPCSDFHMLAASGSVSLHLEQVDAIHIYIRRLSAESFCPVTENIRMCNAFIHEKVDPSRLGVPYFHWPFLSRLFSAQAIYSFSTLRPLHNLCLRRGFAAGLVSHFLEETNAEFTVLQVRRR